MTHASRSRAQVLESYRIFLVVKLYRPFLVGSALRSEYMSETVKILVVEDNDFVRMQIVQFLSEAGHEVIEGTDGEDALQKVSDEIDIAVVDIRMEPIDGFEFIRSIRGQDMDTAVILVTGDDNPDLLNESAKWDVSAVLMKPVQRERLVKTVERTLQMKARQEKL